MIAGRLSNRTAGRLASALYIASAAVTLSTPLLPAPLEMNQVGVLAISAMVSVFGVVTWFLPWERWRREGTLWLVPPTLAFIAAFNFMAGSDTYRYSLFFMASAMWIGATQSRFTCLRFSPLFVVAYVTPLVLVPHPAWAIVSAVYVVPVCVAAGETLGWVADRLARAHAALQQSEERFRALVQNATDVVSVLDESGAVVFITPAVERVMGRSPSLTIGSDSLTWLHPDDRCRARATLAELTARPGGTANIELRSQHGDGSWRWLEMRVTNLLDTPSVRGIVINYRDVTERKALEQQLVHLATHDALSDLPNRALLLDRIGQTLGRQEARPIALLFIDLDNFKLVNDSLGHEAGDRLIVAVADRLRETVRPGDTVARLGGDEFIILLDGVADAREAVHITVRIQEQLRRPFSFDGHDMFASASIGLSLSRSGHDTPESLLREADLAMYRAKSNGKSRWEIFDADVGLSAWAGLDLETKPRVAVGAFDALTGTSLAS